jgi:hypothetical protein
LLNLKGYYYEYVEYLKSSNKPHDQKINNRLEIIKMSIAIHNSYIADRHRI